MKRIINSIIIITFAGLFVFLYSCKEEFLDKQPTGTAAGEVMETPEGVEGLLIGAYDMLTGDNIFGPALGTDWTYGGGASDNMYKGTSLGDQTAFNDVERYETRPDNVYMSQRWRDCYNGVSRTNDVLNFLKRTQEGENPVAEDRAIEIEAEAKFLRAWYHFKATRIWENIPYVKTSEEMDGMEPEEVPNDSPGWDDIEADLQFAIDNLPEESPQGEVGRANQYAAMAVKAYAHLYQNELDQAKTLLDEIISSNEFSLVDNYYDNYHSETENNDESIFEIQVSGTAEDQGWWGVNANTLDLTGAVFHQAGPAGVGWGFYQPSQNLFEAFQTTEDGLPVLDKENRDDLANDMGVGSGDYFEPTDHPLDPRVDWTIARRGVDFVDWGIHQGRSWIRAQSNGGPYMTKKFMHEPDEETAGGGFKNVRNFRAYRYSHVLLWRAEIAVEENELDYARQLVNQIRNRAKNSDYVMGRCTVYELGGDVLTLDDPEVNENQPAANYEIEPYPDDGSENDPFRNQEEARKAVRLEQRLEFATEGMRYFDLRRWGIAGDVLNDYIQEDSEFRTFMQGASSYNAQNDDYWPLPQAQLDIQDALEQDPAYE
ncbi:MAG: RagB/SusD family nutrient uptake outer membrane protein [Bacteroidales bacterium]|nr:RagB/SusD family nutrient uptake outer membrane protein [Bacteroidales bacterium]